MFVLCKKVRFGKFLPIAVNKRNKKTVSIYGNVSSSVVAISLCPSTDVVKLSVLYRHLVIVIPVTFLEDSSGYSQKLAFNEVIKTAR